MDQRPTGIVWSLYKNIFKKLILLKKNTVLYIQKIAKISQNVWKCIYVQITFTYGD